MRYVVWINGGPLLLAAGVSATEENVNAARANMGLPPLRYDDIVNGVQVVWMRGMVTGSIEENYQG